MKAIDEILAGCKKHNVKAGIHCGSVDNAMDMKTKGFDFVTLMSDARLLTFGVETHISAMKKRMAGTAK